MTEAEWLACDDPQQMSTALGRKASKRKRRLFAVACCYRVWSLIADERSRAAVVAAEQFADRIISEARLEVCEREATRVEQMPRKDHWACLADRACSCVAQSHAGRAVHAWRYVVGVKEWQRAEECGTDPDFKAIQREAERAERSQQADLIRDIFGTPFRSVTFDPAWRTDTTVLLARQMYEARDFGAMPILADALQDAGCDNADILTHCRDEKQVHVRGCWVVDRILDKG